MGSSAWTNIMLTTVRVRELRRTVLLLLVIKVVILFFHDLFARWVAIIFKCRRPYDVSCVSRQVVFIHLWIFFLDLLHLGFLFIRVMQRVSSHWIWVPVKFFLLIGTVLHHH